MNKCDVDQAEMNEQCVFDCCLIEADAVLNDPRIHERESIWWNTHCICIQPFDWILVVAARVHLNVAIGGFRTHQMEFVVYNWDESKGSNSYCYCCCRCYWKGSEVKDVIRIHQEVWLVNRCHTEVSALYSYCVNKIRMSSSGCRCDGCGCDCDCGCWRTMSSHWERV
eukprot:413020_1